MNTIISNTAHMPSAKQCKASLRAVNDALYVIGGKWRLPIIIGLSEGKKRFNELQHNVSGISAKVLANELKALEINGFVKKTLMELRPPIANYELTGYSDTLQDILNALSTWGEMHRQNLKEKI